MSGLITLHFENANMRLKQYNNVYEKYLKSTNNINHKLNHKND